MTDLGITLAHPHLLPLASSTPVWWGRCVSPFFTPLSYKVTVSFSPSLYLLNTQPSVFYKKYTQYTFVR